MDFLPSGFYSPKKLWKDPPCYFHGKIYDFDWAIGHFQVRKLLVYQRVLISMDLRMIELMTSW